MDSRPTYHNGMVIPLAVARWFFLNPVDRISLIPVSQRRDDAPGHMRYHSGRKSILWHNWGISLTKGTDRQGRASLVDIDCHDELAEIVAWEARHGQAKPVPVS
ncbi:hypothetical protein [Sphingosinicella sp. BN140058]|uniref:hypothetical protein n=1 Tax=Sphingosinicella sp. BN140058 TaxID=1892855 RepID=UPI0010114FD9|nr:hypothetical protein [Sphingosinicella sp. BN140058]QAY80328.1 hypothetical protein ETR14_27175 [Sphingosinicella sp. BN140058]